MIDIERAVELAAELSGLDTEGWRRQILAAWSFPEIILDDEDDPNWLRQHGSDWVIYMSLSKLGGTPHPMLATEPSRRVETIAVASLALFVGMVCGLTTSWRRHRFAAARS